MKRQLASLNHITAAYFDAPVLRDVTLEFLSQEVAGVVGPNGAGKSTLLKCLLGELPPDAGTVVRARNLTIGYLPQESELDPDATAWEVMQEAVPALRAVETALAEAEAQLGQAQVYENPQRLEAALECQAQLLQRYEELRGPSFAHTVKATLRQVGLEDSCHDRAIAVLSGGQKKLLVLARILVARPDMLLLDEPDNHLDIRSKQLLERLIGRFEGGVVVISHDRFLLDIVADQILEVDAGKVTTWKGNYSEYVLQKEIAAARQAQKFQAQQKEIRRLEASAARLMHWGSVFDNPKFIRRAQSMQKRIDRMERIEKPATESRALRLDLPPRRSSAKVVDMRQVSLSFDAVDEPLLRDLDLLIWKGERVGLVGPNGSGKTVLLSLVRGQRQPTAGEIILGPSVVPGFYDQEHRNLDYASTLIETVRRKRRMDEAAAVNFLGAFQFGYRTCKGKVGALSGGERSRLQMALLMLDEPNFLLLDEPTNNLDIRSAEALEEALADFAGAMLIVSHDRYFLERIANRIVVLEQGRLREFRGSLADYLTRLALAA